MTKPAVKAAEEECERPRRRRRIITIACVVSAGVLITIIFFTVITVRRYKKKKLQTHLEDRIKLLRGDKFGFTFATFLSFASEDDAFVILNTLQPLKVIKETEEYWVCD